MEEASKNRVVVRIPSGEEVEQAAKERGAAPSLFRPSSAGQNSVSSIPLPANESCSLRQSNSFAEAFCFVRQTEFYSPPQPPPQPPPPSASTSAGGIGNASASFTAKQEVSAAFGVTPQARNSILVSRRQQGNPVLKHIRNVRWTYGDIVPDYILGQSSCALYLSLRYHLLHPDYIYFRIRELQKGFRLRVVLCHVDVDDVIKPLHEVTKTALLHDCSLLCAWSVEECGRYLETIKLYENKPADSIQERTDNDYLSKLTSAMTTVRHVNKTDVVTLGSTFGTLSAIFNASMDELAHCPGIADRKVKRLYEAFHEPFRRSSKQSQLDKGIVQAATNNPNEMDSFLTGNGTDPAETNGVPVVEDTAEFGMKKKDAKSVREALNSVYEKVGMTRHALGKEAGANVDPSSRGDANSSLTKD